MPEKNLFQPYPISQQISLIIGVTSSPQVLAKRHSVMSQLSDVLTTSFAILRGSKKNEAHAKHNDCKEKDNWNKMENDTYCEMSKSELVLFSDVWLLAQFQTVFSKPNVQNPNVLFQ